MPEASGEISNEFFKKLNQQIVQKDNLIKLLQLQIRNLKSQLESGEAGAEKANELQSALDQKNSELESLRSELEEQKKISESIGAEKDEQIRSLNEMLEQKQNMNSSTEEFVDNPKVAELEESLRKVQSDYQNTKIELDSLKNDKLQISSENDKLKDELEKSKEESSKKIEELNAMLDSKQIELQNKNDELKAKSDELESKTAELQNKDVELKAKSDELETKTVELKNKSEELNSKSLELQSKTDELLNKSAELKIKTEELESTNEELKQKKAELEANSKLIDSVGDEQLQKVIKETKEQSQAQISQITLEAEAYKNQVSELTTKLEELKADLVTKERNQFTLDEELKKTNESLVEARNEIARLSSENEKFGNLELEVSSLQNDKQELAELTAKLAVAEDDVVKLNKELEKVRTELISQTKKEEYLLQISQLQQNIVDKDEEISSLKKELEEVVPSANGAELEVLSHQVADQLITIQSFDRQLKENKNLLAEKENEINDLRIQLAEKENEKDLPEVPANMDNDDIIASFIDFFDGLDTALSKKSDPELQALHRKLMDKLIVPNKISYMPVISEEFDIHKHIATDYFRSDRFPERCIVFEVEKGYNKGDRVIKKSKVWVVQNLFKCASCGAEQTNPDSRFCHLCGTKILAPNGLPIDSLPIFEPTAITYSRFSERMLEKGNLSKAKEYIQAGLELDPDYLPLILSMADVLISESDFQGAIDYLKRAYTLKPDENTKAKIQNIETKLSIFSQAKNLKLSSDDIDKLLHIIQK